MIFVVPRSRPMQHLFIFILAMSSSDSEEFASSASEEESISSIGSSTSVATADESIGSTIPFPDPHRRSKKIAGTKAVARDTDIAIVQFLLTKQNVISFAAFCNQNTAKFGERNSQLRKIVQNRKERLKIIQAQDPVTFAVLAEGYKLIKLPDSIVPSPSTTTAFSPAENRRRPPRTPQETPPRKSTPKTPNNKKPAPRSSIEPKSLTMSRPHGGKILIISFLCMP